MQSMASSLSLAELSVLTEMEPLQLQAALQQLLRTNMVLMSSLGVRTQSETKYELSELARDYLTGRHRISPSEFRTFQRRQMAIAATSRIIEAERSKNKFSIFSITCKSRGDKIVAKFLMDALQMVRRQDIAGAQKMVAKAIELAPQNFEVHRVQAWVYAAAGNLLEADQSYSLAVELEPKSAPLRMFYGGFLQDTFATMRERWNNISRHWF
jgi:LuxR family transcriptional regulator, glucitol operon activator